MAHTFLAHGSGDYRMRQVPYVLECRFAVRLEMRCGRGRYGIVVVFLCCAVGNACISTNRGQICGYMEQKREKEIERPTIDERIDKVVEMYGRKYIAVINRKSLKRRYKKCFNC